MLYLHYVLFSVHDVQNIPSVVPPDDHGRCGRDEYITNDVILFIHAKLTITHLGGLILITFHLS